MIEHELKWRLNALPCVLKDGEIKIAKITFAFKNPNLISLMMERGSHII